MGYFNLSNFLKPLVIDQSGFNTKTALSSLKALTQSLIAYCSSNKSEDAAFCTIPLIFPFAQSVGYVLLYGQQLAHSLPDIDKADELLIKCVAAGKFSVSFFRVLQQPFQNNEIEANSQQVRNYFDCLILFKHFLISMHLFQLGRSKKLYNT